MLRQFQLKGSLAKVAGREHFSFDVDNQNQLFAALRSQNQELNMAMRGRQIAVVAIEKDESNPRLINDGFTFGNGTHFIVGVPTEGAYDGGVLEVMAIAALVLAAASIVIMLLSRTKTNTNGSGGARSTMFNGAVNTVDQGGAIPPVYGKKVLIGSQIIAVGESYFNTV